MISDTVPPSPTSRTERGRRGVGLYRNAIYWFTLLLIILVVGFWQSYFSQLGRGSLHITHHVHGIAMLLWVLLLMTQSWFIRTGRRTGHLLIGGWLLLRDSRDGRSVQPYLVFCTIWTVGYIGRVGLPRLEVWREFAAWSARVQG